MGFSDYIVYVDESGDHGLVSIDPQYPVFVLAFCIFEKSAYTDTIVPAFQRLKFDFFGHDLVVLHSHDIRKAKKEFSILLNSQVRKRFMAALTTEITNAPFTLIASVIDKNKLKEQYAYPANPYDIAMVFCLERTYRFLQDLGQHENRTTICFECRGKKEDNELELAFLRVISGGNWFDGNMPFDIEFANKQANSTGMQLADLVAYPIGRRTIRPNDPNPAYDVVMKKFRQSGSGKIDGWGLKLFP